MDKSFPCATMRAMTTCNGDMDGLYAAHSKLHPKNSSPHVVRTAMPARATVRSVRERQRSVTACSQRARPPPHRPSTSTTARRRARHRTHESIAVRDGRAFVLPTACPRLLDPPTTTVPRPPARVNPLGPSACGNNSTQWPSPRLGHAPKIFRVPQFIHKLSTVSTAPPSWRWREFSVPRSPGGDQRELFGVDGVVEARRESRRSRRGRRVRTRPWQRRRRGIGSSADARTWRRSGRVVRGCARRHRTRARTARARPRRRRMTKSQRSTASSTTRAMMSSSAVGICGRAGGRASVCGTGARFREDNCLFKQTLWDGGKGTRRCASIRFYYIENRLEKLKSGAMNCARDCHAQRV